MAATITQLRQFVNDYKRQVARFLGLDPAQIPDITIEIGDAGGAAAETDNSHITMDRNWLKNQSLDTIEGAVVHELAHAVYQIQSTDSPAKKKAIERIAEAARYKLVGEVGGWTIGEESQRMAALKPWQIQVVERALIAGTYNNSILAKLENGDYQRSDWEAFKSSEEYGSGNLTSGTGDYLTGQGHPGTGPARDPGAGGGNGTGDNNPYGGGPGGPGDGADGQIKARRQFKASAVTMLNGLGISVTPALQDLINTGFKHDWTTDEFMLKLRETQEYRQRFPGIFGKDGIPKMTEAEYMTAEKAYATYASQAGINVNKKRLAYLFRNDVTPDEFADKALAYKRINTNKEMYQAFKRELVQAGVAKPSEVNTNKELFKFVMGEGNKQWADLWQDTVTRNAANQAGIAIARNKDRYTAIGQKALEHISSLGLSEAEMGQRFAELSQALGTVLPLQEAQLYGVKKKTLVAAAFGGKNSERARQKVERAVATDEAFYQDRAASSVYSDEQGGLITQGVTDRSKQQQSDY